MILDRLIIIGNAGAGKTWVAQQLSSKLGVPTLNLDSLLFGAGAGDKTLALEAVKEVANRKRWIIEGVWGWLMYDALVRGTCLIWLLTDEEECAKNAEARGVFHNFEKDVFLTWIREYRVREGPCFFAAHEKIYQNFAGSKVILSTREEVRDYLSQF